MRPKAYDRSIVAGRPTARGVSEMCVGVLKAKQEMDLQSSYPGRKSVSEVTVNKSNPTALIQ